MSEPKNRYGKAGCPKQPDNLPEAEFESERTAEAKAEAETKADAEAESETETKTKTETETETETKTLFSLSELGYYFSSFNLASRTCSNLN